MHPRPLHSDGNFGGARHFFNNRQGTDFPPMTLQSSACADEYQALQRHSESSARIATRLPSEPKDIRTSAVFSCHNAAAIPPPAIGTTLPVPYMAANSSPIHKR